MTLDEQIAVMQAFRDGAEIEMRKFGNTKWVSAGDPNWDWANWNYRVKAPAPNKIKFCAWMGSDGELRYFRDTGISGASNWTRLPLLDIETEVTE
jgi:hypothetical protein